MTQEEILAIRMRLIGAARTNAELATSAGVVGKYGDAVQVAGKKTAFAAEKSFLLGEGMYSLRRYGFYAITALGLTGAEVIKLGLSFDSAKHDGIDALTSIVGGARAARREVNQLIRVTHTSGLGLGFLVGETRSMLAFGYSVRDTNAYLSAFSNFAGKKGLGEGGVSSLVTLFNRVHDTGFLGGRDIKTLEGLGIPANRALGKSLGLSPAQLFQLQHGQIQIGAASALPALAGYINRFANRQPYGFGQLFSILRGDISESLGGAEMPLFGWLRGKLTGAVTGYNRGGAAGALTAVDPSGGLRTFLLALRNGAKVLGQTLHALWTVSRPVVLLFGGLAKVAGVITGNLTAMRLILEPLVGLYVLDRTQKLYQLGRDKILGVRSTTAAVSINGLGLAAERAAVKLSLIGGTGRASVIPMGRNSTSTTARETEQLGNKGILGGILRGRGRLLGGGAALLGGAGALGWLAVLTSALNAATGGDKRDPWNLHALGDTPTGFLGGKWINRDIAHAWKLSGLAGGGTTTSAGMVMVGERGREVVNLPRGATVAPLDSNTLGLDYDRLGDAVARGIVKARVKFEANGRVIGELASQAKSTVEARQ